VIMRKVLRGVLGTALPWGVAWSTIGVTLRVGRAVASNETVDWPRVITEQLLPAWQYGFAYGAILGTAFAGLVALAGRRTTRLNELSVITVGAAGAFVAGTLHAWVVGGLVMDPYMLTSLCLGVGCASGTLLVAQRSERLAESSASELLTGCGESPHLSVNEWNAVGAYSQQERAEARNAHRWPRSPR
jgi:hypothetical protein